MTEVLQLQLQVELQKLQLNFDRPYWILFCDMSELSQTFLIYDSVDARLDCHFEVDYLPPSKLLL